MVDAGGTQTEVLRFVPFSAPLCQSLRSVSFCDDAKRHKLSELCEHFLSGLATSGTRLARPGSDSQSGRLWDHRVVDQKR